MCYLLIHEHTNTWVLIYNTECDILYGVFISMLIIIIFIENYLNIHVTLKFKANTRHCQLAILLSSTSPLTGMYTLNSKPLRTKEPGLVTVLSPEVTVKGSHLSPTTTRSGRG